MSNHLKFFGVIPALVFMGATQSVCAFGATAEGSFTRTLSVSGTVDLDVQTGAGSIKVRTGDSGSVRVTGTIRARDSLGNRAQEKVRMIESSPPIEQTGTTIRIGHERSRDLYRNVSISYELVVPKETRLRSNTGSGSQDVDGLLGTVQVGTGSGNIRVSKIGDDLRARTGSGSIEIESVQGHVDASTGSGSIRASRVSEGFKGSTGSGPVVLRDAEGDVEVGTGSGSVKIETMRGSLRVHTGSGNITVSGEPTGEWFVDASSGGVEIRLPPQAAFDLDARVGSGSLTVSHPITVQGKISRKEINGSVRGGGPLLRVRTSSGSISIQ